jgi:hypothetical protein
VQAEETAQPADVADPILMNFKRRTNRKLLAERRRRREARDLALKKKLLKARDHRIPTVLSEPAEVRLRKLATKGGTRLPTLTPALAVVSSGAKEAATASPACSPRLSLSFV